MARRAASENVQLHIDLPQSIYTEWQPRLAAHDRQTTPPTWRQTPGTHPS